MDQELSLLNDAAAGSGEARTLIRCFTWRRRVLEVLPMKLGRIVPSLTTPSASPLRQRTLSRCSTSFNILLTSVPAAALLVASPPAERFPTTVYGMSLTIRRLREMDELPSPPI